MPKFKKWLRPLDLKPLKPSTPDLRICNPGLYWSSVHSWIASLLPYPVVTVYRDWLAQARPVENLNSLDYVGKDPFIEAPKP